MESASERIDYLREEFRTSGFSITYDPIGMIYSLRDENDHGMSVVDFTQQLLRSVVNIDTLSRYLRDAALAKLDADRAYNEQMKEVGYHEYETS